MRAVSRLVRTSASPSRPVRSRDRPQFVRRVARVPAAAAADVDAELVRPRIESLLQRAHHRRRDAGRMPVHAHHRAEGLEPERIAQPREQRGAAVVMEHALGDRRAERHHPRRQPRRHASAVQRKIGDARSLHDPIVTFPGRDAVTRACCHVAGAQGAQELFWFEMERVRRARDVVLNGAEPLDRGHSSRTSLPLCPPARDSR